jgi:hypothetical protein
MNNEPNQARADNNSCDQDQFGAVRPGPIGTESPPTLFQAVTRSITKPGGPGNSTACASSMASRGSLMERARTKQIKPAQSAARVRPAALKSIDPK